MAFMTQISIKRLTCARIPTSVGEFQLCYYSNTRDDKEHLALIVGDVAATENVLVRVHSECFTGDVLGSRRCDCGPQLQRAMQLIAAEGCGVILYLRQEGRGIGLLDKLRAYNLQDEGYDTVDANLMLGHQADARDYTIAALILRDLGVASLRLLTNNPAKIESLEAFGLTVTARVPLQTGINVENASYLQTKMERMRHLLDIDLLADLLPPGSARRQTADRPFVTLSYAQSLDGSITVRRGEPLAISGPESLTMTHRLRARHDAILVGIGTVLADDPRLTVRLVDGADPQPVIVDSRLRFPPRARLLQNGRPPWIATTTQADETRQAALETAGARVLRLPANEHGRVALPALLRRLKQLDVDSILVEGGAEVITNFLALHLVDRLVVTIAPLLVGGLNAVGHLAARNGARLPALQRARYQRLGKDMVLSGDVVWEDT